MNIDKLKLVDYALNILVILATQESKKTVTVLSEETGLAKTTINKILFLLIKNGLVLSIKGNKGGYLLAKEPSEIKLIKVMSALQNKTGIDDKENCEMENLCDKCKMIDKCKIKNSLLGIRNEMKQILLKYSLVDLCK